MKLNKKGIQGAILLYNGINPQNNLIPATKKLGNSPIYI